MRRRVLIFPHSKKGAGYNAWQQFLRFGQRLKRVLLFASAGFVLDALVQALHDRWPLHSGGLVHHSDQGSQDVSISLHRAPGRNRRSCAA
jgi:hypothetical protein